MKTLVLISVVDKLGRTHEPLGLRVFTTERDVSHLSGKKITKRNNRFAHILRNVSSLLSRRRAWRTT